ncbi:MAG: hypothetical protein GY862_11870 [Gammaproteobacteria bacterium]|nr:hypothetical protein [Gammaproteobacteria bacterium]
MVIKAYELKKGYIMEKERERRDEIPEEFSSYEDAGEFWDTHDSTDYLDQMMPVAVDAHLEKRHLLPKPGRSLR